MRSWGRDPAGCPEEGTTRSNTTALTATAVAIAADRKRSVKPFIVCFSLPIPRKNGEILPK
jgi:hypothetical protein